MQAIVQANGEVRDFGGQMQYLNRSRRWNWGVALSHVPLSAGFASAERVPISTGGQTFDGIAYTQVMMRQYYQNAQLVSQYPLSTTRRLEFSAGAQRIAFGQQVDSVFAIGDAVVRESRNGLPSPSALTFAMVSAAFVGDYSIFGFTSPIAGGRYRFEVSPGIGSINYTTALVDYRRYLLARPFTFAFRGMHLGRYGSGAESD